MTQKEKLVSVAIVAVLYAVGIYLSGWVPERGVICTLLYMSGLVLVVFTILAMDG